MRSQRPGPRIAAAASLVALVVAPPAGATVPAPAPVLVSETVRSFQMANYPYPPEVTPLAIPLANGHRMIIHPGSLSLICHPSGNDNLIAGDVHPKFGECQALTTPAR